MRRGQAVLEYLLLLLFAVLFVLGLAYQVNDAFRQYFTAWFGANDSGYLYCLIQNGYLPGESEICPLPTFSLKSGKNISGMGNGSGGGGGNNSQANSGGAGAGGGKNGGGAGGTGGGGSYAGGRADETGHNGLIPANIGGPGGKGSAGAAGGSATSSQDTGHDGFSSTGNPTLVPAGSYKRRSSGRSAYVPYEGDGDDGGNKGGGGKNQTIPASEKELRSSKLVAAEKAQRKRMQEENLNTDLGFGNIFKYAAIFALIFALIFFIGSMVVAISRGGRKRN